MLFSQESSFRPGTFLPSSMSIAVVAAMDAVAKAGVAVFQQPARAVTRGGSYGTAANNDDSTTFLCSWFTEN